EPPEEVDRRVADNLILRRAAMHDALAMAGVSKAEGQRQMTQAAQIAEKITVLRAEASVLRNRGYGVSLAENVDRPFNIIGRDGRVLGARVVAPTDQIVFAPDIGAEAQA